MTGEIDLLEYKCCLELKTSFRIVLSQSFKRLIEELKFGILELKSKRPCKYVSNNVKKAKVFNISKGQYQSSAGL